MKKLILLFVLILNMGFASDFLNTWTQAVENCDIANYEQAEIYFTKCINEATPEEINTHPHIYVDRGRLYMLLDRYEEALEDINIALKNENLKNEDLYRALLSRISIFVKLERIEEALEDYERLSPIFPKIEHTEDTIIIRNIPDNEFYKKMVTNYYVSTGICKKESDIKILSSGIIIAKKNKCACGCGSVPYLNSKIDNCKEGCDTIAVMAGAWCGGYFKKKRCQVLCALAVNTIKNGCHWCCSTGSVYEKCIQPFNHILETMGNVCDPAWD
jgi:tetratricopeptide (TPR) repeat protein